MRLAEPVSAAGAAGLAAILADPARAVVAMDFDGTLAPIVDRPQDARLAPGALAALERLAEVVQTVAIITGRPVRDVLDLGGFRQARGLGRLVVLGQYGLERYDAATGEHHLPEPLPGVAGARAELPRILDEHGLSTDAIEDKTHALVVHTRRAHDPWAAFKAIRGALTSLADRHGLEAAPGRLVVDLRPPGVDKGRSLEALARARAARAVLFAGDDLGDLPAYDAVVRLRQDGIPGLTVCSASAEVSELRERADLTVDGPPGVVAFLAALAAAIGDG